jgi:hypothetical protein
MTILCCRTFQDRGISIKLLPKLIVYKPAIAKPAGNGELLMREDNRLMIHWLVIAGILSPWFGRNAQSGRIEDSCFTLSVAV